MNNNPSNMSNEDLERDMEERNHADSIKKSATGADAPEEQEENEVPEEKTMDMGIDFVPEKEQDMDDLVHEQGKIKSTGTIPDPEDLKFRESQ